MATLSEKDVFCLFQTRVDKKIQASDEGGWQMSNVIPSKEVIMLFQMTC